MTTAGTGRVARLPEALREQIRLYRNRGWGPDRIHKEMRAVLEPRDISAKTLGNWIYSQRTGSPDQVQERLGKLADLLEKSGIDPEDIGQVKTVKLSEYQMLTKDDEGEAHIHDLEGASIVLAPAWAEGPKWPVVQPAKPTTIRPVATGRKTPDGWKRAVVLPDPQIGFRRDPDTGELDPFHDETAISAARRVVRAVRPDRVVLLGDVLDFAEFSRFEQEPAFAQTTQAAVDRAHRFCAEVRADAGDECEIEYLEGNHDRRLQKSTIANAKAAFGLRRASPTPEDWPVLSVPHLLRLDDLGVKYVSGYPANITWLNDNLACIHGHKVRSAGSTAAAVIDDERVSVIFGHVHRIELQHRTRRVRDGAKFSFAATPGCLCRLDGSVPSTKGSTDPFGRAISNPENWQHGCSVVTYEEGDGRFSLELVPIHNGATVFRGRLLTAELPAKNRRKSA